MPRKGEKEDKRDQAMFDDETMPKAVKNYQIGQALDDFSLEEIEKAIETLKSEITRLEAEKVKKSHKLSEAEAFFQKKTSL